METVGDIVGIGALRSPERIAITELDGAARTYRELDRRTTRLANALLGRGLRPGDRVAAWMDNCVPYVELYFAVAKAGLVIAPINSRFTHNEAAFQLRDCGAKALFLTPGRLAEATLLDGAELPALVVTTGELGQPAQVMFETLLAEGGVEVPAPPRENDLYIIGYTSGTTGFPKGAMLTHRSVRSIARSNAISYRLPLGSVGAFNASMSFVASTVSFMITHFFLGGTVILMPGWNAQRLVEVIERKRVTYTSIPSPALDEFADVVAADPLRVASLHSVLHASSKARPESLARLARLLGDRLLEGWGMTENSGGLLTATTKDDVTERTEAHDVFASAGRAVADTVVEVIGEDGRPLPHDGVSIGELIARSPSLMVGYWNRPDATAQALRDGWYHTGDLGAIDEAGYVYISDRRTDLIVTGGMNVYPSEVERAIRELTDVRECAVIGLPHQRWGQTVVAVVQPRRQGAAITAEQVIDHCRGRLASYKKPTRVVVMDELPRTASGKIRRQNLRSALAGEP